MSKMTGKRDHETSHSLAREVYASNILDASLPRLDGFERCGESFDTIISANPFPTGSAEALKKPELKAERFTKAVLIELNISVEHQNEESFSSWPSSWQQQFRICANA